VTNRVTAYSTHVLQSIEKEFYLEKEMIDKKRVRVVAAGLLGKSMVMQRLLYHISDGFNNLLMEHFFRGIITREIAQRCTTMLLTAEEQQTGLLVAPCPYDSAVAEKFLAAAAKRETKRKEHESRKLVPMPVPPKEGEGAVLPVLPKPQPERELLEPLRVGDTETSSTPLKKLLFKSAVPPVAESLLHSIKNTNITLLDDIDVFESYSKGATITGTSESLYIKSATGKVVTSQYYDYGGDTSATAVSVFGYLRSSPAAKKDPAIRDRLADVAAGVGLALETTANIPADLADESGRPGSKISMPDSLARLKRKRRDKTKARYGGTRLRNSGISEETSDALSNSNSNSGSRAAVAEQQRVTGPFLDPGKGYQDADSFASFASKFREFRDQQYASYNKAIEEAKSKIQEAQAQEEEQQSTDGGSASGNMSLTTASSGEKSRAALEKAERSAAGEEEEKRKRERKRERAHADADPSLQLLRLNPRRWYQDEKESRYRLPPTADELQAAQAHEEQQRQLLVEKKEKEQKVREEQRLLMEQHRILLKKRTAYLWHKLRDHARVIGKMTKVSHMEVVHDAHFGEKPALQLLRQSDSTSSLSTVSMETRQARDQLIADLQLTKNMMKDVTTFETEENKIIVIQKKTPRQKLGAAQGAIRATLALSHLTAADHKQHDTPAEKEKEKEEEEESAADTSTADSTNSSSS
jgi:hypothetical protein